MDRIDYISSEDQDPIMEEMDVYLSQEHANNLYLFQYALRPTWRQYNLTNLGSLSFHPQINHVEMQLPPQSSPEEAASYADMDDFESANTTLTLSGVPINEHGPYAVGFIRAQDGVRTLVLHPIVAHLLIATHQKALDEPQPHEADAKQARDEMPAARTINDVSTLRCTKPVILRHFDASSVSSRELCVKLGDLGSMMAPRAHSSIAGGNSPAAPRTVTYTTDRDRYLSSFSTAEIQERERAMLLNDKLKTIFDPRRRIEHCIREFHIVSFKSLLQIAQTVQVPGKEPPTHEIVYNTLTSRTVFVHGWFVIKSEFVITWSLVPFLDYLLLLLGLNTTGLSDPNSLLHTIMQLKDIAVNTQDQNKAYLSLLSDVEKQQDAIVQQTLEAYMSDNSRLNSISRRDFTAETGLPANNVLLMFRETGILIPDKDDAEDNRWRFRKDRQKDLGLLPVQEAEREIRKWIDAAPSIIQAMHSARKLNKLRRLQDQGLIRDTLTDVTELPRDALARLYKKYGIS